MNIIYVLISSLFYILSFPTWNFWWLSFIAIVPFLLAIEKTKSFLKHVIYGGIWSIAISSGLGYWLFPTLYGNYEIAIPKAILFFGLCVFLPIFLLILGFIFAYRFMNRNSILFYIFISPSLWTLMDYLKETIPILIPWGEIGYAVIPFDLFIQMADIVGVYGITFIIIMINGLICYIVRNTSDELPRIYMPRKVKDRVNGWPKVVTPLILIIFLFLAPMVYGKIKLASLHSELGSIFAKGLAIDAQLIQGNFSLMERWSGMGFYSRIQKYLEMTGSGEGERKGKRVIVWPETTLNSTTKLEDALFLKIMGYIGENALLISGGLKEDEETGNVLNSAYLISGQGQLMRYDKHILLPYAETSPLIDLLDRYYTAPNQFQPGSSPLSFQTANGCAGISICFETLYPNLIRKSVKHGAGFLVNISNDAWFGDSPMPYTHLNSARLRAIENRRFMLRTSNSGISAIISPDGKILSQSRLFVCEQVIGHFLKLNKISIYTRLGNIIVYLSVIFLFIALSLFIIKD